MSWWAAHVELPEMQPFYRGQFGYVAAGLVLAIVVAAIFNRRALSKRSMAMAGGRAARPVASGQIRPGFCDIRPRPTLWR